MKKAIYSIVLIFSSIMILSIFNNGINGGSMCFTDNFLHCPFAHFTGAIWDYCMEIFYHIFRLGYIFDMDWAGILTLLLFLSLTIFSFLQIFSVSFSIKLKK